MPPIFSWLHYDSLYHLANALDMAVARGLEFEDPETLHSSLRTTRFTGCSGYASFDINTNDRSFAGYDIYQYVY